MRLEGVKLSLRARFRAQIRTSFHLLLVEKVGDELCLESDSCDRSNKEGSKRLQNAKETTNVSQPVKHGVGRSLSHFQVVLLVEIDRRVLVLRRPGFEHAWQLRVDPDIVDACLSRLAKLEEV